MNMNEVVDIHIIVNILLKNDIFKQFSQDRIHSLEIDN